VHKNNLAKDATVGTAFIENFVKRVIPDLKTQLKWYFYAEQRARFIKTQVLFYEDLLANPQPYVEALAEILGTDPQGKNFKGLQLSFSRAHGTVR